jgi:thiamine-phosphate pyrophosphorylase
VASNVNGAVLRLLDANANRAREALRVLEDYARFVLDDKDLSAELKSIRHDLANAMSGILADAILHRDTAGDVGTTNKVPSEGRRDDLGDIVIAAGKRLGEALRAIEEYLKTLDAIGAVAVERLRYRFYSIEQRLTFTLRPAIEQLAAIRLYVLITESQCRRPWLEAAEEAILGGADCLQLREKTLEGGELLRRAELMVELCHRHGVLAIINDRADIAILSKADGVHIGQDDLPTRDVRRMVGSRMIVGVSTHRLEQAKQAVLDGADYIGVGPVYRSATKPRDLVAGLDYARAAAAAVTIPSVAIAGISDVNVDEVMATGVQAVAVTAAVLGCEDVRAAAGRMKARICAPRQGSGTVSPKKLD